MRSGLAARAARHGGVFTRRDAVECGYTERELKTLTGHGGAWVTLRRGVYAERAVWDALGEDDRYTLTVRAMHRALRHQAVVSHQSAAALLQMPLRPRWRELLHVTRPGVRGGRTENGVKHHPAAFDESEIVVVDGIRVTGLARTAVDIGRESGYEDGVVACDAALRLGAEQEDLERALVPMSYWPGITGARAAVAVSDGGAETIGESLTRLLVLELDIGRPQTQFEVCRGTRKAFVDLRVGRHLFEFDGKVKYVGRERGGVADRPVEEIVWAEKKREDWLRSLGFGVSRVIWDDLFGEARRRTRRRLAREYQETLNRNYGAA